MRKHRLLGGVAPPRRAGPPSTPTPPTPATRPPPARRRCSCRGAARSRAIPRRRRPRSVSGSYLAVNAQTAGGCSLMVWENDNNGRQRWCTRLVHGGGFASPLFDGFDNLYIGQPGLMLSYPPTQWIRWREHVIGMPTTTRFLGGGQLLVVTHLGQVLVFDAHRGVVIGTPMDLVEGLDPTRCHPRARRLPAGAAAVPGRGRAGVLGSQQHDRRRRVAARREGLGAGRPAVPPRADAADHQGVDQRCRDRRGAGRAGAVPRRQDVLRQWPRPASVGTQLSRRQGEMVCAAGLSTADTAVGVARRG